ncbi:hypothetical protein LJK88_13850 [Paenibacillus sp. P26]|nr:hypothetical protein LJK88_13850 [Paenibacillus sp. P26]
MRKCLSIVLALLLALSLAACGKGTNGDVKVPGGANSASDSKADPQKAVTLSIAMHVANVKDQEPYMYGIVQKFQEKYPNIKIDLQGADTDSHVKKMKMVHKRANCRIFSGCCLRLRKR